MFLEDFSSEPIAMCKILLYVESTEIHIAGENDMKRLAWLSVEDYAATQMELVVVSAMKGYLRRMPEKEAFKKVEAILDPKVIRLAGDDGAPMLYKAMLTEQSSLRSSMRPWQTALGSWRREKMTCQKLV